MTTGQWENVAPNFGADATKYTAGRDFQKKFDLAFDPGALYVAYQCLLVSHDGAHSFTPASPDLTTAKGAPQQACGVTPPAPPPPVQALQPNPTPPAARTGPPPADPSINDFSISRVKQGVIWTVSSNGQIFNTMDHGKAWTNVTNLTDLPPHTSFSTIVAGDDVNTAYVAGRIGGERGVVIPPDQDADVPLIWRTTDAGKTWSSIVTGLPRDERTGSWVNTLRVDPVQPGLLFAGTETTVYVSFDNGDHWQSLRQNLPSTSIRDLDVHTDYHQNDLVIGTYGRGFWVLDDITPLREIAAKAPAIASSAAYLFQPEEAIRARNNSNWDQPTSIEVPHVPNAPYGVFVDYLPQPPAHRPHPAPGLRRPQQPRPHHLQHAAPAHRRPALSPLLAGHARIARAQHPHRPQPHQLGPLLRRPARPPPRPRKRDEHGRRLHHRRPARPAGHSRRLHAQAHRRRPGLHPQRHRHQRSPRRPEPRAHGRPPHPEQAHPASPSTA